jgi:predicted ATPase
MDAFHALVGPNASGKTTFLDVVAFLGRLVADGPEVAVRERTENFEDLVWGRSGDCFELAIEAYVPTTLIEKLPEDKQFARVRYEVRIGIEQESGRIGLLKETVLLKSAPADQDFSQSDVFPHLVTPPSSILSEKPAAGIRTVVNKVADGNDNFYSEVHGQAGKDWAPSFRLGPLKSALGNLPADDTNFPVATWLRSLLADGVQAIVLNSLLIRKASPPGQGRRFRPDGSNLPWIVESLSKQSEQRFHDWIAHLRSALPDLEDIRTVERADDKHRYLMLRYQGGFEVPSWMASDGTLRLLALTLPAYLPDFTGVYLIEEPENGIHPRAVETMVQSLSSVYDAQILLATHSPVVLSVIKPEQVLCFAKTEEGVTDIVRGDQHPNLRNWRHQEDLSVLFAAGVLG